MRDIASATLSGNLTRDVELRELPSGAEVARLRVATTTRRRNGEEWVDKTNYFTVEAFGAEARVCAQYLAKGSRVVVDAELDWREWTDQQSNRREAVTFRAPQVLFEGRKTGPPQDGSEDEASPSAEVAVASGGSGPPKAKPAPTICRSDRSRRSILPPDLLLSGGRPALLFFVVAVQSSTCGREEGLNRAPRAASVTLAAVLETAGNVTVAMQPPGFRFDEDAVLLDGTAHWTDCPLLAMPLPRDAVRRCAGEVLRAQRCPRACICASPFETLLSFQLVAVTSSKSPATL